MRLQEHILFDSLFEIYGSLLTERQNRAVYLHVREDLSLSEIAEHLGITKQAVSDALTAARLKLEDYEAKLHLLEISREAGRLVDMIRQEDNISRDLYIQADRVSAVMKDSEEENNGI